MKRDVSYESSPMSPAATYSRELASCIAEMRLIVPLDGETSDSKSSIGCAASVKSIACTRRSLPAMKCSSPPIVANDVDPTGSVDAFVPLMNTSVFRPSDVYNRGPDVCTELVRGSDASVPIFCGDAGDEIENSSTELSPSAAYNVLLDVASANTFALLVASVAFVRTGFVASTRSKCAMPFDVATKR